MKGSRQHLKRDWDTCGCTDQMQPPPKEAPLLGGTSPYVVTTLKVCEGTSRAVDRFTTSSCSYHLAHRNGQTVYDESLSLCVQLSQKLHNVFQPALTGKIVQASVEARCAQRFS